jgi:glyoxylate reductase
MVTNTPKVLTEDTADMTMALILAVPRRLIEGASILTEGKHWAGWSPTWMLGHRIGGKRLGIIGMGRIGQAVARRARAFGLQIHYHNRRPVAPRIADELVNTARGEVTDEDTLVKLIEAGEIGGAGLDVYEHEPAVNPKLVRLAKAGKVTLLPHMGSATIEGRVEMGEKVIINIRTFLDNHKPPDRVLPSML